MLGNADEDVPDLESSPLLSSSTPSLNSNVLTKTPKKKKDERKGQCRQVADLNSAFSGQCWR